MRRLPLILALWLASGAAARAQVAPFFTGTGDLAGGAVVSTATGVSSDGGVVVGSSESSDGQEAYRWTPSGGIVGIGFLSLADPRSEAAGVSDDGLTIVGTSHNGSGEDRAFRWSGGGFTTLGTFSCSGCDPATTASGVSGNGLVVVGAGLSKTLFGSPEFDAARWTGGGTGISDLGDLPGPGSLNAAHGASSDGAVIVGAGESSSGTEGWWWTSSSGMNAFTGPPGALIRSAGLGASDDGTVVFGSVNTSTTSTDDLEAARWTGGGFATLELLGALPGATGANSEARAATPDGAILVGRAVDAGNQDTAFLWNAVDGMRALATVLADDYGLDTTGWTLMEANDISHVAADGSFTVVGSGLDPAGHEAGFVAFLAIPACRNGIDDDMDGDTDFPDEDDCTSEVDFSEAPDCSDTLDNDGDGDVDAPADAGCRDAFDATEQPDCSDGLDNDGDGLFDTDDPGCGSPEGAREDPACNDGVDNDGDLDVDFPDDAECVSAADLSEEPDCNDGLDNDGDGFFDLSDADCEDAADLTEAPECSDGLDNDGDGSVDYPAAYPACSDATDGSEAPQCADGEDNDGDGDTDGADAECDDTADRNEADVAFQTGDLLVVDRSHRTLFAVDPATGTQTLLSVDAYLSGPEGIDQTPAGFPVIADPVGLVEVSPDGSQRLASPPLFAVESLQVVFQSPSTAFVLEDLQITKIAWSPTGIGTASAFLTTPTPEPIPVIGQFSGDTLAIEASGDLLTSGIGFQGDGVMRVDGTTGSASVLAPGFTLDIWRDLAVESDGTIVGVSDLAVGGVGIHRIDPTTGVATALNVGGPWVFPTGVAAEPVPGGDLFVADSGTCVAGSCSGGEIVRVDPVSGSRSVVTSGGFLQGELDLVVALPEPGAAAALGAGAALLLASPRGRRAR